jgi:hypothetical protein
MNLTTEQRKFQRGVRLLAITADKTAELGVDFKVDHSTDPSSIVIWNVDKLGAEPTAEEIAQKVAGQVLVRKRGMLRRYVTLRIQDTLPDMSQDALRLAYLGVELQGRELLPREINEMDRILADAEIVRLLQKARTNVAPTVVITDTIEEIQARYDAECVALGV